MGRWSSHTGLWRGSNRIQKCDVENSTFVDDLEKKHPNPVVSKADYTLMGTGFGVKWDYEGWNLGAMVAWRVGNNPLYSGSPPTAVNTDGTTTNPRGWVTASYQF